MRAAQLEPLGADAAGVQPAPQGPRHHVEEDVVDRAAERVLGRLEVGQVGVNPVDAPVRAARLVERRLSAARRKFGRDHAASGIGGALAGWSRRSNRAASLARGKFQANGSAVWVLWFSRSLSAPAAAAVSS